MRNKQAEKSCSNILSRCVDSIEFYVPIVSQCLHCPLMLCRFRSMSRCELDVCESCAVSDPAAVIRGRMLAGAKNGYCSRPVPI